jgi:hypothetical protein
MLFVLAIVAVGIGRLVKDSPINYAVLVNSQPKQLATPYSHLWASPRHFTLTSKAKSWW